MIFAYNEDGTLEVVSDEAEAHRHFEGSDVESGAIRFFDDSGRALAPTFPQRSERRFLGLRVSNNPGPFELVLQPDAESLQAALGPAVVLMPNRWFTDVDVVRAHLSR